MNRRKSPHHAFVPCTSVGFIDPNTAIFFSGIGTLIFFVMVGGRVPSYLGSSFSFIAVILIAENTGHVKAVAARTNRNLDKYLGRAFLGDAVATIVSGFGGGTGVTTYAETVPLH